MITDKKRVLVAMSGGVDSSVAAYLLKKQGYSVTGVYFKLVGSPPPQLKKICRLLGINLRIWDFSELFKKEVIDQFIHDHKKCLTPNPCVICNRLVKFSHFYKKARLHHADYIATGHYARTGIYKNHLVFKKAADPAKDQSYFLWAVRPSVLKYCLFPLGNFTKSQVKKRAKKIGLWKYIRGESQEICFIKDLDRFLSRKIGSSPGPIKNIQTNNLLGKHAGLYYYTLGQRSGLGLSGGPWYVAKKEISKKVLFVTNNLKDKRLYRDKCSLKKNNLFVNKENIPDLVRVKIRYNHPGVLARVKMTGKKIQVLFKTPQKAVTPGQSAVIYQKDILLGGGTIE